MELKWNLKQSGIYAIKNKANSKIYIGKSVNIYRRKYQHLAELKGNKHKNKYLQYSFNKYGEQNFEFYPIEFCNVSDLGVREYYWINHYKSFNRNAGYNIELLSEDGNTIRSYESINKMRLTIKENKDKYIRRKGKDNPTSKEVYQYDLNGNYLKSFGSCHEAAEQLGCKERFTAISKCARKESGSSFDFQWRYYKADFIEKYDVHSKMNMIRRENNLKLAKPIIAINLETMEEIKFNSISEAANKLGLHIANIAKIVSDKRGKSRKLNMTFKEFKN